MEAPMLAEAVATGTLPPLEERLPPRPLVNAFTSSRNLATPSGALLLIT